eukprot:gnl/MRDRNA2_/MRDRNA2_40214_c0_seq1.p1 gnl/MRDRNA2_/MRDRNA2_40214_c0~~gnl/MRDRNA2_/MRDRNA2_40214_c0_seq1.p1  ORF type:complete len:101 (-),score=5.67 gnl/MRDRNA2_/MRDRNA2_40214_c0_seq1:282-584(-)
MSSCTLNLSMRSTAAFAKAANSSTSNLPAVANAHTVLARSFVLKPFTCLRPILANTMNSYGSDWHALANAHAVVATPCASKSQTLRSATCANAWNSCESV